MNTQEHETYSLRFVDEQKYKPFLLEIATEVERLLVNKANRKCFERYSRWFHKKWTAYKEALEQWQQKIAEYRKKSSKDGRLRNKKAGPPENGYLWYDDSPCETGDPNLGFWVPSCEKPHPDPALRLIPAPDGMPPQNHEEELEKYYVLLIIIHDWMLPSCVPIDDDARPKRLGHLGYIIDLNLADEGQSIIEIALEHVKADLKEIESTTEFMPGNIGIKTIVNEIHRNKDFFCEKWIEFCRWVEGCGKQLEKYQKEHTDEKYYFQEEEERPLVEKYNAAIEADDKKAVNRLKKALYKKKIKYKQIESKMEKQTQELKQKGWYMWSYWDMLYLDLPMKGSFPAPPDIVNPVLWLFDKWNPRPPNQKEQFLLDCALLCATHDVGVAERKQIYRRGTYEGTYFECDNFCNDLQDKLDDMDKNGDIQRAWDDVEPNVKVEAKQDAEGCKNLPQIANSVHKLIQNESKKRYFQKHIVAFRKAKNKFAQALKEAQKAAKANPKLRYDYDEVRDKDKGAPKPPQKDYEVEFHHVLDDYPKEYWRPKLPFNPDGWLSRFQCKCLGLFHPPAEEPRNKDDMFMCEYALLAAIHDEALDIPACDRLTDRDKDDWVESLWENVSHGGYTMDDLRTYGERMRNINTAFNDVEADLAKKEVETEQETEPQEKDRQEQTITLKDFIKKHCDLSERPDIDSKCEMLMREHRNKRIKLPRVKTQYRKGQRYLYYLDKLLNNWSTYRMTLTTLPPLKKSANK